MLKQTILKSGDLISVKKMNFNKDTNIGGIQPFCILFKKSKEECEKCFENELEYIKSNKEIPYNYIDLDKDMILLYVSEASCLTGEKAQEYFKAQMWTKWHKLLLKNKVVYLPEQFLTDFYIKVINKPQ